MINVTKPFLPDQDEYLRYIQGIWKRNWLTNNGPLVNELELKLKEYLDVDHLLYLSNGTIAIQIAIKALGLSGEIITTPFSYVATTSSIVWEACTPVFADIEETTLNIDPSKIEALISERTSAILATHVYGNACDVEAIEKIATKHGLKVIYDGAHCFGTKFKGKSLFEYGDITTTSFHATKVFHTIEGGAVITRHPEVLKRMALLRNFGHTSPVTFEGAGINGKNSEVHAAMGLCNLKHIDAILASRKQQSEVYDSWLLKTALQKPKITPGTAYNYSYYPVIFPTEEMLLKVMGVLEANWIYPRRYFYPSLNQLNYVQPTDCAIAESISSRVLCLPIYYDLTREEIDFICRLILRTLNN
jgi:dTDP-4-amino-4,6-dideoxygalactose transaminase